MGESGAFLDREAGIEDHLLVKLPADQVKAERKPLPVQRRRYRHGREPSEAGGNGEDDE